MHQVLRATSITLREAILAGIASDPDLGPHFHLGAAGTFRVSLGTPQEMREANIDGVSLWLYRVERDEQLLNLPPARPEPDRELPTRLPLRLHYLVAPVITADQNDPDAAPEREQTVLGRVLQVLYGRPIVRGSALHDLLAGTDSELGVRLETLSLEEITRIWHSLQRSYQLSVSYEVTVAYVAPETQPAVLAPVDELSPDHVVVVGGGS